MFGSLMNDLIQRRLWPIPLVAILVAIAVPLLFMDSSDDEVTAAPATPAATQSEKLPDGADALLSTEERVVPARRRGTDPFDPPAAVEQASDKDGASAGSGAKSPDAGKASQSTAAKAAVQKLVDRLQPKSPGSSASPVSSRGRKPGSARRKSRKRSATGHGRLRLASVDVRYGETKDSPLQRTIPPRKVFQADGEAIAVFIRYSRKRNKALFAVAPGVQVTGSVACKRIDGVCRYLAIPDGGYVRLRYERPGGERVTRRIDVSIHRIRAESRPQLPEAKAEQAGCVLDKLLSLPAKALSVNLTVCS